MKTLPLNSIFRARLASLAFIPLSIAMAQTEPRNVVPGANMKVATNGVRAHGLTGERSTSNSLFGSLHSDYEHLPAGGRVSWINETTTRIELMFYPAAMPDFDTIKWDYNIAPQGVVRSLSSGEMKATVSDKPVRIQLSKQSTNVFEATVEQWSRKHRILSLNIVCQPTTRFYGLGGQFLGTEHSGKIIECQSTDPWGENLIKTPNWSNAYFPVPFLFTTDGYALWFKTATPLKFTFPDRDMKPRSLKIELQSSALDLYVIRCSSPIEAIREYHKLTGQPYVPPKWAMEPLIGHGMDHQGKCFNQKVLDSYLAGMRTNDIYNGIIYDEAWSWSALQPDGAGGLRLWMHPEKLGDFKIHNFEPEDAAIKQIHAAGQKVVFHISPFIGIRSEYVGDLLQKGYLVMRASAPATPLVGQYNHYFLDFTNPDAVKWWQAGIRRLIALGVDGFFNDFGEGDDQRDALYQHGTGASRGQEYCILNRKALYDVLAEMKDRNFYLVSRAGWSGMQHFAGALTGDQPSTFEGMRIALSAMQSFSMSGQGIYAHNLGGYAGEQDSQVYLRWVQLGIVSPLWSIWSSGSGGEPWLLDKKAVDHYRSCVQLRMKLLPYLYSYIREYGQTGMPLVRPMAMLFPNDAKLAVLEDQFMCGGAILVAPILSQDGSRSVVLPEGMWRDFWTGRKIAGGCVLSVAHDYRSFPIFVREGGLVPMEMQGIPTRQSADLAIHVYGLAANRFTFYEADTVTEISSECSDNRLDISCGSLNRPGILWVGHGTKTPVKAEFSSQNQPAGRLAIQHTDGDWSVRTPATGGKLSLVF